MTGAFTKQAEAQSLLLKLLDPANRANPYPVYAQCRNHGPIQLPAVNLTIFSSYRDCDEVLWHSSSSIDARNSTTAQRELAAQPWRRSERPLAVLTVDPPDHTRLRKLVNKAFVPKVVNALRPEITALVDGLLDRIAERGRFDAVADLAHPLPVAVLCRLLGAPLSDEPKVSHASALLANTMDPFIPMTDQSAQAGRWLQEYLYGLVEQRRAHPGDDLTSCLVAVEESGDRLASDEIVSIAGQLLISGHETTTNLLANAILAMLRHPEQWAALGADADRAGGVIAETLRYDTPAQTVGRYAADDMTIGDTTVVKGDTMVLLLGAAQRDPAEFERPDAFDPERKVSRHLAFGRGPHYCVGAPLARLEASIALPAVTARFPKARLTGEPLYKPNVLLRGLAALPVSICV